MAAEQARAVASDQKQLVVFRLAGELYGVDIHQVREIIRGARDHPGCRAPPGFLSKA